MPDQIFEIFNHSLMISGFVFVMMLLIEYLNVLTSGTWQKLLTKSPFNSCFIAAILGVIPGCLGAFVVVTLYIHRILRPGAVVAAMIATSGDEAFVMLALIPKETLLLNFFLLIIAIGAGISTDFIISKNKIKTTDSCDQLILHNNQKCNCFPGFEIITAQWKKRSPFRIILTLILALFVYLTLSGQVGPQEWNWIRFSILFVTLIALFIIITVPDHFLEEHLWQHVSLKHIPRIFAWTFGTLLVMHLALNFWHIDEIIQQKPLFITGMAAITGLIPESGPHLVFVTLFQKGVIPFSILLVNSIVQDGHGMLPLLAHSRRDFFKVKAINLTAGLVVGALALIIGF